MMRSTTALHHEDALSSYGSPDSRSLDGVLVTRSGTQEIAGPAHSVIARRALFELISAGEAGVTLVSAPPGSGKTVLLRSWIDDAELADRVAWVSVERGERDAQRFWLSVIEELRAAVGADAFVERLTPMPEFDGGAVVERLASELGSLDERVVLVVDDLHELSSPEALAQLEVLLARRPPLLQVVLATRHDPQLGLHRLRVAGRLTEVREADLRFSLDESRELLTASGAALPGASVALLHARTEGWVAGLRMAALALAGHPEPERVVAEFSGGERTVAEYLLAEVLERQPGEVRRLLLRTSILERVNGALADVLVGASGSERILHALEEANAFVVSLDAARSWFRYHHLFADLLRLELRRTEPDAVGQLHHAAARWYEEHGYVVEAVRHAQAAQEWRYAARLLADHRVSLTLNGEGATVHALLAAFPAEAAPDPELMTVYAADRLNSGSLDDVAAYIALAERHSSAVPDERRREFDIALGLVRLALVRRRGDFGSVLAEVQSLVAPADAETTSEVALSNDARALALLDLGIVEQWSLRTEEAVGHFEEALELARRIGRPYIEVQCLGHLAIDDGQRRSFTQARKRAAEAIAIGEAHGWGSEPIVAVPLAMMALSDVWQGRFEEAEHWLGRAERALRSELDPAMGLFVHLIRGRLLGARGRLEQAIDALRAAERLQPKLGMEHGLTVAARLSLVQTLVRLGETEAARATLAEMSESDREWGGVFARVAAASVHLADGDAQAAVDALAPVLDGSVLVLRETSFVPALLLDAMARDQLDDPSAAEADIEHALELAEPDGLIWPFVMTPPGDLLERHPRHRTAHAALLQDILDVLAGSSLRTTELPELREDLSKAELRVLRYLPSNLPAPEIGRELFLSVSTVRTHMRHIYAKLGVHRRTEAVERARELGLLAPSSRRR
jgi:LuxR family transcriptional regulator, maltose regulon positive regulatory protein